MIWYIMAFAVGICLGAWITTVKQDPDMIPIDQYMKISQLENEVWFLKWKLNTNV